MKLAVNYSQKAADLVRRGEAPIDLFKCPAWPDLVDEIMAEFPVYVHFPLKVGLGIDDALNTETKKPADWTAFEKLLKQTGTPLINAHLWIDSRDLPDIPPETTDPAHEEMITANLIRDVEAMVRRFGAERVIVENVPDIYEMMIRPVMLPGVISQVVRETGCGFLLDIAHARLAAYSLGIEEKAYISALPVDRLRELHVTGIRTVEGDWSDTLREAGFDANLLRSRAGQTMDHMPMTAADLENFAWAMDNIHSGVWAAPWVVTYEYGGVGRPWEPLTDANVLGDHLPKMYDLVHPNGRDTRS
ncbi:MAG: DUF692 family protein [Anaerolineae bacterium]|nr:DUF692 family protein [Anaerolineae bacterium]